ncbi:DUF1642 domain-containing protein [Enterococcus faecalis]|jgi:hypothetical protein|uniref:DUF1642 domain-containing protein n=1 Tax=Enterococcus TaxID=1350 RepID=UPI0007C37293|nr:DUF1642 domain-containing protein [Enterococcus faecalis]DAY50436.1 MAG TPA: Protein of unknown function (DUF1642) [Caudoviricetes sp.]EGO5991140.1 DUF1642 domain-containing protein [Enterococcus faecalis]EGO7567167.1 DUF1642 domain-containing protein [Enterococcus faecalis]EGO8419173.1 DUF1642 domain-containing protein [Enterococcus faecalis]MBP4097094.1 DUF1642 domain-containing protein [Enterococcus faecalis]
MNKQELIEKIKYGRMNYPSDRWDKGYNSALEYVINIVQQLDEPKKVIVPKVVADWLEYTKKKGDSLIDSFNPWDLYGAEYSDANSWIDDNQETFARAWIDGYEVEKEPRYVISVPDDSIHKHYLARFINNNFEKPVFRHIGEEDPLFFKDKAKAAVIADWVKGTVEQWEEQR